MRVIFENIYLNCQAIQKSGGTWCVVCGGGVSSKDLKISGAVEQLEPQRIHVHYCILNYAHEEKLPNRQTVKQMEHRQTKTNKLTGRAVKLC